MQAWPYQDSKKSRIGTRISAILHSIIKPFSERLGNVKRTGLPHALMGVLSLPSFFLLLAKYIQLPKGSKMWEWGSDQIDFAALSVPMSEWVSHRYKIQAKSVFFIISCGDSYGEPSRTSVGEPQRGLLHGNCSCFLLMPAGGHVRGWGIAKFRTEDQQSVEIGIIQSCPWSNPSTGTRFGCNSLIIISFSKCWEDMRNVHVWYEPRQGLPSLTLFPIFLSNISSYIIQRPSGAKLQSEN